MAPAIRDHEADIEPLRGDIDLDEDAALVRPAFRLMPKTGPQVNGWLVRSYRVCACATRPATRALNTRGRQGRGPDFALSSKRPRVQGPRKRDVAYCTAGPLISGPHCAIRSAS